MSPATEPIEMMRPPSSINGAAVRTAVATPPTLTANSRSSSARLLARSSTWPQANTPALLTRMSRRPKRSTTDFTSASTSLVLAWSALKASARTPFLRNSSTTASALSARGDVADGDVGAVVGEGPGDRRADAARAAGDEGNLSC